MDERGQGSMEMLALIAGVVLVAVVVAIIIKNIVAQQLAPQAQGLANQAQESF